MFISCTEGISYIGGILEIFKSENKNQKMHLFFTVV
jgi:hypothetical protein